VPTILDRLLGRAPDSAQKAVVTGTGGTGPGVIAWHNDLPLHHATKNPRRLMKQAQELYHRDLIIRAAEHRVSSAMAGLPWHLEDENEDEVTDQSPPELIAIRDWLDKPQGALTDRRQMTRRALWHLTSRHSGLCGTAFWYQDQRTLGTGQPLVSLYINPARMHPVQNEQGILTGWKLDADEEGNGGIPLELDEVLQFDFEPPDWGHYGIGLVESAWSVVGVSGAIERHEASLFSAGARLAGLISPKTGVTLSDDQWAAAVRDWRNITGDPESAKRLHILRGPVDYTRTGATMQELAVESIAKMAREDKLALWGVPESQLPLPSPAGLNSGDTKGFDEAAFYQGAVHDRVLILSEVIQTQVLDRIAANGGPALTLVIEEPAFDNETPLYDRAQKARDLPMTANERRAVIGLPPLPDIDAAGEPLGTAIWLPVGLSMVGAGPDENGKLVQLPEPPPPPAPVAPPQEDEEEEVPAKADFRRRVETRFVPSTKRDIRRVLADQAQAIAARIRRNGEALARHPKDTTIWWTPAEEKRLTALLEAHNARVGTMAAERVREQLGERSGKADTFVDTVLDYVRKRTAERIVDINRTTRETIADLIRGAFAEGLGPAEVADRIEAATVFDEARAERIARTETMLAYNEASLTSFRELGVDEVEAIDGDEDEECAARDGQRYPIDEAFSVEDHPNGTLDWAPVIKARVDPVLELTKAVLEVANRPQPTPVVNNYVNTPDVHAAPVNVYPGDVIVHVPEPKPMRKVIERAEDGTVKAVTEEPA
jgi:hypothetical protein